MTIKRYDPELELSNTAGGRTVNACVIMREYNSDGEYVAYDDHIEIVDKLEKEIDSLLKMLAAKSNEINTLKFELSQVAEAYTDLITETAPFYAKKKVKPNE